MTPDEYNAKLNLRLGALIGVLITAIKKIEQGMTVPGANIDRMTKIRDNLANTLAICERAQSSLAIGNGRPRQETIPSGMRAYTELSSLDEYRKFQMLPPITQQDISSVDWNKLQEQLNSAL